MKYALILLLVGTLSSLSTYILNVTLKQGPVRASALVSFFPVLLLYLFPNILNEQLANYLPSVVFGASFIGMASSQRLGTYAAVASAGFIFSLVYLQTDRYLHIYGGTLGTTACVAVLIVMSIPFLNSKRKLTVGILQLRRLIFSKRKRRQKGNL